MYEQIDISAHRSRPPSLLNTMTELPRAMLDLGGLSAMLPSLSLAKRGDGHPLLLIPGFVAGDMSLGLLKRYTKYLGYNTETWGVGRNMGHPEHLFELYQGDLPPLRSPYGLVAESFPAGAIELTWEAMTALPAPAAAPFAGPSSSAMTREA